MACRQDYDVVVVGAGPVGFTLAIDLGRRGIRTLLVEKDPATKEWPKMDRSNARTMEIYRRLGIADEVRAVGYPADASMDVFIVNRLADEPLLRLHYPTVAEHRARIATSTDGSEPLEPYQLVAQNDLEPVLLRTAESTPNVTVRFGCALADFEPDDQGVTLTLQGDAGPETLRAAYLAGCDGGVSTVRKKLGIPLEGQGGLRQLRQVTFRSESLYDSIPIGTGRHYYLTDDEHSAFVVQGSRKEFTLNSELDADADLEQAVRERVGFNFDFTVRNSTSWKLHLLLAERYREGRVFLAGDAVHLVIPTGGLGMNTGIGDAIDLAWKLAGTVQGWGGPGLLNSYEVERRAVGARNVQASGWAAQGLGLWREAVTPAVHENTSEGDAARREVAELANIHHRRVHEMIGVELGYTYAGSDLVAHEDGNVAEWDTTTYVPHARPGVRLPHVWLPDGRAVQDAVGADYTFLDLTGRADTSAVETEFLRLGAPLEVLRCDDANARRVYDCSMLLLRPDLHVFWRGETVPPDVGAWARQATGWFTRTQRDHATPSLEEEPVA